MKKVLSLLLCLGLVTGLAACSSDDDSKKEAKDKPAEKKKTEYAIGETAEVDGIKITINSVRNDGGKYSPPEDGNVYFVMDVTIENTTDETFHSSSMISYTLKDGDGRKQDLTILANLNGSLDMEVEPGESGKGEIGFKTGPEGKLVLTFAPNTFKDAKAKFIVR